MEVISLNVTSTQVPEWKEDCQSFCRSGKGFEVRDVKTPDHEQFIEQLQESHTFKVTRRGRAVRFERA